MRCLPLFIAAVLTLGAAGCTSSSSAPAPDASTPSGSAPATNAGTAVAPATLAATVQKGLADATSVHLTLSTAVAGGSTIKGSGDLALHAGTITQADVVEALPDGLGSVRLVRSGGETYAKLPAGLNPKGKTWTVLSTSNKQPLIAQLARTVDSLLAVASPSTVVTFIRAASSVRDLGTASVDGATQHRYLVVIDASKLSSLPGGLSVGSATSVPLELSLDPTGRPAQLRGSLQLSGQRVVPTVTLTDYDKAVSITAPPASRTGS